MPGPVGVAQWCADAKDDVDAAMAWAKPCASWVPNPPDGAAVGGHRAARAREAPLGPCLLARSSMSSSFLSWIEMGTVRLDVAERAGMKNRARCVGVEI